MSVTIAGTDLFEDSWQGSFNLEHRLFASGPWVDIDGNIYEAGSPYGLEFINNYVVRGDCTVTRGDTVDAATVTLPDIVLPTSFDALINSDVMFTLTLFDKTTNRCQAVIGSPFRILAADN